MTTVFHARPDGIFTEMKHILKRKEPYLIRPSVSLEVVLVIEIQFRRENPSHHLKMIFHEGHNQEPSISKSIASEFSE